MRQPALRKRCKPQGDSGMVRTQRYFHHLEYLYASRLQFKNRLSKCHHRCVSSHKQSNVPPKLAQNRRDITKSAKQRGQFEGQLKAKRKPANTCKTRHLRASESDGTGGRTRTDTSRGHLILSQARLPFHHTGIFYFG